MRIRGARGIGLNCSGEELSDMWSAKKKGKSGLLGEMRPMCRNQLEVQE